MYYALLVASFVIPVAAMLVAYRRSRDLFHPAILLGPIFIFMYAWMPFRLLQGGTLEDWFAPADMLWVQGINVAGMMFFFCGCVLGPSPRITLAHYPLRITERGRTALLHVSLFIGAIGFAGWFWTLATVGGFVTAFSESYGGGWHDLGYVRDSVLLLTPAVLLMQPVLATGKLKLSVWLALLLFATPWLLQGVLGARRGPLFVTVMALGLGHYLYKRRRPNVVVFSLCGMMLGYAMLFVVTNRDKISLTPDLSSFSYNVGDFSSQSSEANEYVYGTAVVLNSWETEFHYWGKRYFAIVFIRPIPKELWPTKYEDFGVPELRINAGTMGSGLGRTFAWNGVLGSAPGIVADLWVECKWLALPLMGLCGFLFAHVWRKAVFKGNAWIAQYIVCMLLGAYFVVQDMEPVLYRVLVYSIPMWFAWHWVDKASQRRRKPAMGAMTRLPAGA
jgi:oligosaccharide repeat unit polymerase